MERDKIIEKFNTITDVKADKRTLYEVMTELGIQFKKTNCVSCLKDYYNIVREELGMIEDASVLSDFDREYIYIPKRAQTWNGYIIDDSTPVEIIKEFIKKHPKGYYKINENTMKTNHNIILNPIAQKYAEITKSPAVGELIMAAGINDSGTGEDTGSGSGTGEDTGSGSGSGEDAGSGSGI